MSFDPLVTRTSLAEWESLDAWRDVPELDAGWMRSFDEVVVFAAHPDDETLGVGALLAGLRGGGPTIRVAVATCEPSSRALELSRALTVLGVTTPPRLLGLPDGGLRSAQGELLASIEDVLRERVGSRRLVLAPWPGDRHGDHRTLGRLVERVCARTADEVRFYPIWLWQWGTPDDLPWQRTTSLKTTQTARTRKAKALRAFTSQLHSPERPDGVLTAEFIDRAVHGREIVIDPDDSTRLQHFEQLHAASDDPWKVRSRWYERRKRALQLAALPREQYGRAFEVGCSIGATSTLLAQRCGSLLSVDGSEAAVVRAKEVTTALTNVTVQQMRVPEQWPDGRFDLIVVSELAYYLDVDQWNSTIALIRGSLADGGHVLLCHWTGTADDFSQTGAECHRAFRERSGLRPLVNHTEPEFLLEVFG